MPFFMNMVTLDNHGKHKGLSYAFTELKIIINTTCVKTASDKNDNKDHIIIFQNSLMQEMGL